MRHRPIQAAPRERVPFTLWGRNRIRQALATATAAAVGLVPVVMAPSPAYAAPIDFLKISDAAGWEGGNLVFTVTYTGTSALTANFGLGNGTATLADTDYAALTNAASPYFETASTQIVFSASSASAPSKATITVPIPTTGTNDLASETFKLRAVPAPGDPVAAVTAVEGTGTIWDFDAANTILLSGETTVDETASAGVQQSVTVTATQTRPQAHDVVIPVKNTDVATGTTFTDKATSAGDTNRDYTALGADATIVIPANETVGTTKVTLWDDAADEQDTQWFNVEVDTARTTLGGTVDTDADVVKLGIRDDDDEPAISIGDATSVKEGGKLTYPVTLSNPSEKGAGVTVSGTGVATAAAKAAVVRSAAAVDATKDAIWDDGPVPIPRYAKSTNLLVTTTTNPNALEGPENVRLTLTVPTNASLGTKTTGDGTITDSDTGQTLEYSSQNGTGPTAFDDTVREWDEGSIGAVDRTIYVRFSPAGTLPTTLSYKFVDGTAKNGTDYIGKAGTVKVLADATVAEIPVTIIGDRLDEPNPENFKLVVTDPGGVATTGTLGDKTFEINDDDDPPVWTTGDVTVQEGNTGTTLARVPVKLSSAAGSDVTFTAQFDPNVTDTAKEGTGVAGFDDYDPPKAMTTVVKAGSTEGYFEVPINGDAIYERDETLTVAFTAGAGVTTTGDSLTVSRVTVGNDDALPKFTYAAASGPEGGSVTVVPTVVGSSAFQYDVGFTAGSAGDNPASVGADFEVPAGLATSTVRIPVGFTGPLSKLSVPYAVPAFTLLNDDIDEPTETFTVTANEVSSVLRGFAPSATSVKVTDDPLDLPPAVSIADIIVDEKAGSAEIPVDLAFVGEATSTTQTVTVPFWTMDGSAKDGKDYTAVKGELKIPPGQMKWSIKVPLLDDWDIEENENFTVRLGSPGPLGASVIRGDASVTIKSDDTVKPSAPSLTASGPAKGAGNVTISGKTSPNTTVELWGAALPQTDPASFKWLAEAKSDGSGNYTFPARSLTTGFAFATKAHGMWSPVRSVKLSQSPSLTVSSTKGKVKVVVTGNPKAAGQKVTVQRYTGGKWVNVGTGTTTASNFTKTYSFKSKTSLTLRAMVGGTAGINAGTSATKKITVK